MNYELQITNLQNKNISKIPKRQKVKTVLECVKNAKRKVFGDPGSGNFKHGDLKGMQDDKGGGKKSLLFSSGRNVGATVLVFVSFIRRIPKV
ncbi:MAG: hypothetical protein P9L96_03315 [Candidatus Gygaella obscura]|nr:hypothetical protein [Candidatus Gygaella obscura]